ncbi:hypothetical protein LJK88_16955 [Paenibacillus sp. P26]|nr:hypothetical protein LJK88_16955 [Paenibacillus sp. P26]
MYQTILGIDTDENRPGFKHSVIRPRPGGGLRFASGEFGSVYGQIRVEWRRDRSDFVMHVQIPVNTTATVYVPGAVRNGEELESRGLRSLRTENGADVYSAGSGSYTFHAVLAGSPGEQERTEGEAYEIEV